MTVGKMSFVCWTLFAVMSAAFLPLAYGIYALPVLPATARITLAVVVVGVLWWAPFGYAMYLTIASTLYGDRRLLRRGVRGTAVVLSAKATSTYIRVGASAGSSPWYGSRVHKYRLRVSVDGRRPYETTLSVCAAGIGPGSAVEVAVSPHNHKRVAIDVERALGTARGASYTIAGGVVGISVDMSRRPAPPTPNAARIEELTQLGRLHSQGVLTDAEFAAQKARILDEIGD